MVDVLNDPHGEVHNWPAEPSPDLEMVVGPPAFSRFLRNVLIIFGGLALITVLLVVVRDTKYSPSAAVDGYLSALAERDTKAALERLDPQSGASSTSLSARHGGPEPRLFPPTNYKITKVETDGDRSTVTVSMTIGGSPTTMEFDLVRDSASLSKVFRPWRITTDSVRSRCTGRTVPTSSSPANGSLRHRMGRLRLAGLGAAMWSTAECRPTTPSTSWSLHVDEPSRILVSLERSSSAVSDQMRRSKAKLAGCAALQLARRGSFLVDIPGSDIPSNVVNRHCAIRPDQHPTDDVQVTTKALGSGSVTVRFTDSKRQGRGRRTYTFPMDLVRCGQRRQSNIPSDEKSNSDWRGITMALLMDCVEQGGITRFCVNRGGAGGAGTSQARRRRCCRRSSALSRRGSWWRW